MLRLVYSDRFENLVDALVGDLREHRADPLEPQPIVVPNQRVASYVKIATARRLGVAANLSFPFAERLLAERLQAAVPESRVIDGPLLHHLLLGRLEDDELMARPELSPVAAYAGSDDPEAAALRRFSLASRLSRLFIDYSVGRPALLGAWRRGRTALSDTAFASAERWQRVLLSEAIARVQSDHGAMWDLLPNLLPRVAPMALGLPPLLPIIGYSYLAPGLVRMLAHLARERDVVLYTFNPCREYWDDVGDEETDTAALRLWGRPGRDTGRLLGQASGYDFRDAFSNPDDAADTSLGRLHKHILMREPDRPGAAGRDDWSIRVLACPNIRRELEIIGNEIWRLMREDPTLRFNDIAVLLPRARKDIYQAHLGSVFKALLDIPCSVADLPLASESRVVEALELLLDIPLGRFSRPQMLRLLCHPAVIRRYPEAARDDWIRWTEKLGIVHGGDRSDHAGTYIERDLFNWDQGIRRLALGSCMAGAASGSDATVAFGGAGYVPFETPQDARPSAARLGLLVRSIVADARALRTARLPLAEWASIFDDMATTYVFAESDDDLRSFERAREGIGSLIGLDIDDREIDYPTARQYAGRALASLRGNRGELLSDGVVVAPLAPMTPLPFRVVFAAGLGEGLFPAGDDRLAFDLRQAAPATGDIAPRDRDRYAFLETICAARERLYLSYVARDDQTGETLEPSSVVAELCRAIDGDPLERHPLRRYDDAYFGPGASLHSVDPLAHREHHSRQLRRQLEGHVSSAGLRLPARPELIEAFRAVPGVAARIELSADPAPDRDREAVSAVSTSQLRKFFESPLQAWATTALRMREAELSDPITTEDEPFATHIAPETGFLREVFVSHLRAGGDRSALADLYRKRAALEELRGHTPTGLFGKLEQRRHLDVLSQWLEGFETAGGRGAARRVCFGRAREHRVVDELLDPIRLDVAGETVEIYGDVHPVADIGSVVLVNGRAKNFKYPIRACVDHVLLAAAGVDCGERAAIVVRKDSGPRRFRLAAWTRADARAYLEAIAGELFGSSHDYLLPCEAVFKYLENPDTDLVRVISAMRDQPRQQHSGVYGPVDRFGTLEPPDDAAEMIERRFRPLVNRLEERDD